MPDDTPDMPSQDSSDSSFDHISGPEDEADFTTHVYTCPHCQQSVTIDPHERGPFISCPHCGESFAIARAGDISEPEDSDDPAARARDAELDGMRIRQLSVGRRAAIRARTYLIIGVIVCLTGAEELIRYIAHLTVHKDGSKLLRYAFAVFAAFAIFAARYLWIRFAAIGRELKRPLLEEPAEPADFSTLSNGSQRWKDLEDIQ